MWAVMKMNCGLLGPEIVKQDTHLPRVYINRSLEAPTGVNLLIKGSMWLNGYMNIEEQCLGAPWAI